MIASQNNDLLRQKIRMWLLNKLGGIPIESEEVKRKPVRREVGFGHVTVTSEIEILDEHPYLGTFRITQAGTNTLGWIRIMSLQKDGTWVSRFLTYRQIAELADKEGHS